MVSVEETSSEELGPPVVAQSAPTPRGIFLEARKLREVYSAALPHGHGTPARTVLLPQISLPEGPVSHKMRGVFEGYLGRVKASRGGYS